MLEFNDVTLGFGTKQLLNRFNCTITQGEFVGILGANGVGKSTLLRAILGLIKPQSGSIQISGKRVQRGHPDIGYMPQAKSVSANHQLTGRTYLGITLQGLTWGLSFLTKAQQKQLDEVIELTNLQSYVDRPYIQLSGGERQRLALAQALLNQPKILILDEPLSSVDLGQQLKIINTIRSIQQHFNITVLLTSHDINPLLNTMTKIIYLTIGKAAVGTVAEVINSNTLSWLYDTPIDVITWEENKLIIQRQSGRSIQNAY